MAEIKFYGTRCASSLTSEKYMEFGGATTCIMVRFDRADVMIDCGSGVNNALEDLNDVDELHLFISHCHLDHIVGIVSLLPAFKDKKLHIYGKTFNDISVEESINRITSQSLWPIKADIYKNVIFHEIDDEEIVIEDIHVTNMDSNHPDGCSLYRFRTEDDDITSAFDFCHLDGYDAKLKEFAKGTKVMIYDGTFSEEEFPEYSQWGHSTPEEGCRIGKCLGLEQLYITHFGVYDDETLTKWEERLQGEYPFVSFARSGLHKSELLKMIDIGSLLNTERDNDSLLFKIVEASMDITSADGGTLYLLNDDELEFKVLINRSKKTRLLKKEESLSIPPVKLNGKNICATAAREKKLISVEDRYNESGYDFSGAREYDELNGYLTKSVLAVPLLDDNDELIGVLQLINAKDKNRQIIPFKKQDEGVVLSIASQAAMAIVKSQYSQKVDDLLYGFVRVMSVGIDERTPYNANHTKNMVSFADRFFDYENETNGRYSVDDNERREILMSIWLHDIGKILIPLEIMNKDTKLGALTNDIEVRNSHRDLLLRLQKAENKIDEKEYERLQEERQQQFNFINLINLVGFLTEDSKKRLDELSKKTYRELDGKYLPVITKEEYHKMSTSTGTLTPEERTIMKSHVEMTQKLLSQLRFPKKYENIPEYAGNHHEFMDGSGYPNHLKAAELSWPCRLITVLDIYEALISKDRPYKKAVMPDVAFSILREMANEGKIDLDIINEFEKSETWK